MNDDSKLVTIYLFKVVGAVILLQFFLPGRIAQHHIEKANKHYKQDKFNKALKHYNKAIDIKSENANTYMNRGQVYQEQENFKQALEDYTKAIEINPILAEAYYQRGIIHAKLGNEEKAIQNLEKTATLFQEQGNTEKKQKVQQKLNQFR